MTSEAEAQARWAQSIFETSTKATKEGLETFDPRNSTRASQLTKHYREVAAKYKESCVLSPAEIDEISESLLPFLRYIHDTRDGATPMEGSMVRLEPGQRAVLQINGFCLDLGTPTPRQGERLQLIHASRLIPEELFPLYKALLRYYAEGHHEQASIIQNLLWGMRAAKDGALHLARLNPEQCAILNAAMPGGASLLQNFLDRLQMTKAARDRGKALFDALARTLEARLGAQLPAVRPDGFGIFETQVHLTQLGNLPTEGDPAPGTEYSTPIPGLAAKTEERGVLTPVCIELINTNTTVVWFDTCEYAAQSVRFTQRVALAGEHEHVSEMERRLIEVLQLLELRTLKNLQRTISRTLEAYGDQPDINPLEKASVEVASLLNELLFPVSLLDILPLTGRAAALCRTFAHDLSKLGKLSASTGRLAKAATAESITIGNTMLGHFPEYTQLAARIGARKFQIPTHAWPRMTEAEQWSANERFLERLVRRGDVIHLATPLENVRKGSHFERELDYLLRKGYALSPDGAQLRRKQP